MLEGIKSDLSYDKKTLKSRRKFYATHKEAISVVAAELKLSKDTPVTAYAYTDHIYLAISGDTAVLKEIFRTFRKLGYEPSERPGIKPDAIFITNFNRENGPRFRVSFSSTICKRVKVGTETIERDVYETVCE